MKISKSWLSDYIEIERYSSDDLAEVLTSLGIEVETIEEVEGLQGEVVCGKILATKPHPNADSLQVCDVDVGSDEPLSIVCGASNAREGIFVAVAKIGSILPGDFKIKPSKIRGEKSFGMLCSGKELGVSNEDSGIMELPEDSLTGESIAKKFRLSDTVFELGLTPNRADCLGYIGIARDLSAKLGLPLKLPEFKVSDTDSGYKSEEQIKVTIENEENCGRFSALSVKGLKQAQSPSWMQNRLNKCGMRPINLIVDVTNYVMLEYSQPIHAYDIRDISGAQILVRSATANEKLKTLDGNEHSLKADDIVICDNQKPIGLAGVMGGENSEVKDDTSEIVIEVASFHPIKVRKTSKRLGIHTEASHRFERGTDITCCADVANRVAYLISKCMQEAGLDKPVVSAQTVDIYPSPLKEAKIALRLERLQRISGDTSWKKEEASGILESLGFELLDHKEGRMVFSVPSWRHDILREIDLIEEAMRVKGFDALKKSLPVMEIRPLKENDFIAFTEKSRSAVASLGLCETMSFPFVSNEDLEKLGLDDSHPLRQTVGLKNAIVATENQLQPTLIVGLLKALDQNIRQGTTGTRLFECARTFLKPGSTSKGHPLFDNLKPSQHLLTLRAKEEDRIIERPSVAAIWGQPLQEKNWNQSETVFDFYHAKTKVCELLSSLGVRDFYLEIPEDAGTQYPFLHPGACAVIKCQDQILGYLGEVHPSTVQAFGGDFSSAPVLCEILLEPTFNAFQKKDSIDTESFKFPPSSRDLAFIVDRGTTHNQVVESMTKFRKRNLKSFDLFDLYSGDKIESGKQSMAYKFRFQSAKRTLNDKEIDKEVELLLKHMKDSLGAELR